MSETDLIVVKPQWNPVAVVALVVTLVAVVGTGALFAVLSWVSGAGFLTFVISLMVLSPAAVVLGIISIRARYRGRPGGLFGVFSIVFGMLTTLSVYGFFGLVFLLNAVLASFTS